MDNLGWRSPPVLGNNIALPPSLWSNRYDNFSEPVADYRFISGEADLDEALFSTSLELQGIEGCEANSNFDRIGGMVEMLAPALNSTNNTLDLDFLQQQEPIRSATNSVIAKSVGTTWVDAVSSQLLCSFPSIIRPEIANSSDSLTENFSTSNELQLFDDIRNDEDGVLSTIFSSGENIRNFCYSGNISDEAASQGSSNPDPTRAESSNYKPNSTKRNMEDCDVLQSSSSTTDGGFQINFEIPSKSKKPRSEKYSGSSSIDFRRENTYEPDTEAIAQVKEMIYRAAALRPVLSLGVEDAVGKPKRKNVRISSDPQTVAARHRRERISERLRVLQRMVPGGSKMDTASMLDEAANYLKFLKSQVEEEGDLHIWKV